MTAAITTRAVSRRRGSSPSLACKNECLRRIRVDGVEARYLIAGSGPPVLVVASPLVLARTYRPLVRCLASSFTVVVVEPPGSGGSDRLDNAWNFERYGAWLVDLVRRMPLAGPIVIGHSDSAAMVIEAARLAPEELSGIVLVGACGASEPRSVARLVTARAIDALGEPGFSLRVVPHLLRNVVRHRGTFLEHVRAAAAVDSAHAAADVRAPTLLAWGDRDRTVPLACASRLGRVIDGAKLVVGSGSHDWLVTHPEAFGGAVRRFASVVASSRRS
jgi:pimeloyl-ACP methyl ester carboxylesterase